jgi:uncharacterized membrane protein
MAAATVEGDEPAAERSAAAADAYGVGRLLAFSDGVFAIAITLLVLSIPVPDIPPHDPRANARLLDALLGLTPNLGGFALSFVLVGAHWMIHHRLFRQVTRIHRRLMWLNLLALLGICLVPFATTVLIRYGDTPTGAIAYASLQIAISLAYFALRVALAGQGAGSRASALLALVQLIGFVASIPLALAGDVQVAYVLWVAGFAVARAVDNRMQAVHR